jgi:mono/diheme cytochrome c family protein
VTWAVVASAWFVAVLVRTGTAQSPPADTPRSTLSGVYTADQAKKGQTVFSNLCIACHTTASHKGQAFSVRWNGKTLFDLFQLIQTTMPVNDAGNLPKADCARVIAYVLKLNGLPAGADEVPTDPAALKLITIELPAGPDHHATPRPPQAKF